MPHPRRPIASLPGLVALALLLLALGGLGHVSATDPSSAPSASPDAATSPKATVKPSASPSPSPTDTQSGPPPAAGPPFPAPVNGVVVYDYAGIFKPATEASLTSSINGIEDRTGAEIVVYTQLKPQSDTPELAEQDAIALIDQWGVGRKGFDDGLAILFDMDRTKCHGQIQLYAGPGFRAAILSNEERQAIYEDDMLPLLRGCALDAAVLASYLSNLVAQ